MSLVLLLILLGLVSPLVAQAAEGINQVAEMDMPRVRLLSSSPDRSVVRIDFPVLAHPTDWNNLREEDVHWALPNRVEDELSDNPQILPPGLNLTLAVPTRHPVVVRVFDTSWWRDPREVLAESLLISPFNTC